MRRFVLCLFALGMSNFAAAITCQEMVAIAQQIVTREGQSPHIADAHFSKWVGDLQALVELQSGVASNGALLEAFAATGSGTQHKFTGFSDAQNSAELLTPLSILAESANSPQAGDANFVLMGKDQIGRLVAELRNQVGEVERGHSVTRGRLTGLSVLFPVLGLFWGGSEIKYSWFNTHVDISDWAQQVSFALNAIPPEPGLVVVPPPAPKSGWLTRTVSSLFTWKRVENPEMPTAMQIAGYEPPSVSPDAVAKFTTVAAHDGQARFAFVLVEGVLSRPVMLVHFGKHRSPGATPEVATTEVAP